MLTVRVELNSAITGKTTEIARMHIWNDGSGDHDVGNYKACSYRGRTSEELDKQVIVRTGVVKDYPRMRRHVWNLVSQVLQALRYDTDKVNAE